MPTQMASADPRRRGGDGSSRPSWSTPFGHRPGRFQFAPNCARGL